MTSPQVSVVMSVFNGERFLRDAVESILDQSLTDFEFIIVDDGSTDGSASLLEFYKNNDPRVRVYSHENRGLVESLNIGCGLARGKYIARMDADDIALRDRLALQVNVLEKHHELGCLGGAVEFIKASGVRIGTRYFPTKDHEIRSDLARGDCPIFHPTVVMRTSAFISVGGYRKVVVDAEDYDLWLRIADSFRLANLDTVVLKYRLHLQQVSVRKFRQQVLSALAAKTASLSRSNGNPDPLESIPEVTPAVLTALGVSHDKQHAHINRGFLTCIRSMSDAGEATATRETIEAMLASPEWRSADLCLVADFGLLSARIYWRQQRYMRSIATAIHAFVIRPVMIGRPLKPLLRRLRLARPAL